MILEGGKASPALRATAKRGGELQLSPRVHQIYIKSGISSHDIHDLSTASDNTLAYRNADYLTVIAPSAQ
jgi:hypothetical protein